MIVTEEFSGLSSMGMQEILGSKEFEVNYIAFP
jgi:hypothetical protein